MLEKNMRYEEVKQLLKAELEKHPQGFTWEELKRGLDLPYKSMCPEWITKLEIDICLIRKKSTGRAYIWKLSGGGG